MKRLTLQLLIIVTALAATGAVSAVELVNLTTTEAGMHRITYEQLQQAGADLAGLQHTRFALTANGEPQPVLTRGADTGNRRIFGPGGYIEFYAEEADNLYSAQQVFTLHLMHKRQRGLRKQIGVTKTTVDLTAPFTDQYRHTQVVEENNTYDFSAPSATDPFHFGQTFSLFATPTYSFTLDNVVGGSANASIDVEMYGIIDFDIEGNDHHYEVLVNGTLIGDQQFDGNAVANLMVDDVLVNGGQNTLKFNYRPIQGVAFDRISLNRFTVTYPRTTDANNSGYLEGYFSASQARVSNLGAAGRARVYRRSGDNVERIINGVSTLQGDTVFGTGGVPADYIVVAEQGYKTVGVLPIAEKQDITTGTAEYLIISHPGLIGEELDELVQMRSNQYLVKVVDVNQVYAQFGHHRVGAAPIKDYIKHAAANMDTQMVLLVGADTLDYKQFISDSVSLIPTNYVVTPGGALLVTQTPSDAAYGDLNDNGLPSLPVGRISARTKAELTSVVQKIKAYQARQGYVAKTVIATDKEDLGNQVSFLADAEAIIAAIPPEWSDGISAEFRAFPDVDGEQQAHDKLLSLINAGASVVSYIGHSSQQSWAYTSPPMLRANEITDLTNVGKPTVVTQWGCWNTYFVDPSGNTMSDVFLLASEIGAASVLGASTLTTSSGERAFGIELNKLLYQPGMALGQAIILAKQALAQKIDYPAIQMGYQLLGDPALVINAL